MKKSLMIAAVAMAMGVGIGAQAAVSNATFGSWSFESVPAGTVIPGGDGMTQAGYESWSASSNDTDFSYITNISASTAGVYTNVAAFNGGITNAFGGSGLAGTRYVTEFKLLPGQLDDPASIGTLDPNAYMAFYFNTASNFVLKHGTAAGGAWVTTTNATVAYPADTWVTVKIDQDWQYSEAFLENHYFTISINGTTLTNDNGYTRSGNTTFTAGGGPWFPVQNLTGTKMNALVGLGMGKLDDVANALYTEPAGNPNKTITVLAANAAWGTITPSGPVVLVDATTSNFAVSVKSGVQAYLSSFDIVNGANLTNNADPSLNSATWSVAYSQVSDLQTVVVSFVALNGSSTKFMSIAFPGIGLGSGVGSEYATFQIAATNDADADGFNNESEAAAGTLPYDNTSYLKIGNITVSAAGQVTVSFLGSTSGSTSNYVLKANDAVTGTYTNVAERAKNADATLSVNDTPAVSPKFYKITLPYTPIAQP